MNTASAGTRVELHIGIVTEGRIKMHPASGARARIITNRRSGVEVELTSDHNSYRAGNRLIVGEKDFFKV